MSPPAQQADTTAATPVATDEFRIPHYVRVSSFLSLVGLWTFMVALAGLNGLAQGSPERVLSGVLSGGEAFAWLGLARLVQLWAVRRTDVSTRLRSSLVWLSLIWPFVLMGVLAVAEFWPLHNAR